MGCNLQSSSTEPPSTAHHPATNGNTQRRGSEQKQPRMKLYGAVARQYSRCNRTVVGGASRRRPLSSSSLTSAIDSNHRAHESATAVEATGRARWVAASVPSDENGRVNGGRRERRRDADSAGDQVSSGDSLETIDSGTERDRAHCIIQAYAKAACSSRMSSLPSLSRFTKISDDFSSSQEGLFKNKRVIDEAGASQTARTNDSASTGEDDRADWDAHGPEATSTEQQQQQQQQHPMSEPRLLHEELRRHQSQEGGIPMIEKICATGDNGEVEKELMLSKLLVGLHRRVRLLAGLRRRKALLEAKTKSLQQQPDQPAAGSGGRGGEGGEGERMATGLPALGEEVGDGERQNGQEALEFFKRIRSLGAFPPPPLWTLLVQVLAAAGLREEADEQFADLLKHGVLPPESCATMVIRVRVETGKLAEAMEVLAMMEGTEYQQKFHRPRFRSYQPVICELLRRGDVDAVLQLWKHMQWHKILPKESFLLDLFEGLANSNENGLHDANSITQLADHFLDGVSKTLIYTSAPMVKALLEGWKAKWTGVSDQEICNNCGEKLQGMGLSAEDRARMRSSIVHIAAQNGAPEVQRLSWFANWFDSLEDPPTAIIDGPNVAYMDQNFKEGGFMLAQVDWLAEHLHAQGERVVITMPWFYCIDDDFQQRKGKSRKAPPKRRWTKAESEMLKKWVENDWLLIVEGLDDLYWMYATVARSDVNTVVVTNDLMRDHRDFFPGTREFVRWKRSHLVSFSFGWQKDGPLAWANGGQPGEDVPPPEIKLRPGASWKEVQRTGAHWHLPVRISRNARRRASNGETSSSPSAARNSGYGDSGDDPEGAVKNCLCVPMMTNASSPSPVMTS